MRGIGTGRDDRCRTCGDTALLREDQAMTTAGAYSMGIGRSSAQRQ